MKELENAALGVKATPQDEEIRLVDVLIVLAKHKKLILALPAAVAVVVAAFSLLLPNVYQASAKLLPPQQQQSAATSLLSQLGGAAGLAAGVAGIKNPSDLYIAMLKSRRIEDRLIARFNLKTVYKTDSLEKARKALEQNSVFSSGKDGLISVDVQSRDPKLAAQLANAYIEELTTLTRTLAMTEASQRRVFFEQQLEQAKNNLATAEMALKQGLDTKGVTSVDVESRAILETVGRLRAQVSAKEIQLNSMRPFMTENNPAFQRTAEELSSLRSELAKLQNGRADPSPSRESKDRAGLDNIKLLRDVKYYQMLYELLAKQYEVARLDEAKEPMIIQVLDSAVEPERAGKPKRAIIVILSAVFALMIAIVVAFLRESQAREAEKAENATRWNELRLYLRLR